MLPTTESLISLTQAKPIIKRRTGRRVDKSTIWRWAVHGLKGVRLEHVRAGREIRTSAQALDRFYQRLTLAYQEQPTDPAAKSARHDQAERELDAAGV